MTESFKEWMSRIAKEQSSKGYTWSAWPKSAKGEIERVLEHNDNGEDPKISMRMLIERLKDRYGIETNQATIRRYVQVELDRKGWKK